MKFQLSRNAIVRKLLSKGNNKTMSDTPQISGLDETQQNLLQLVQVASALATPFIKNPNSQNKAAIIVQEASAGAIVLPSVLSTLGSLYTSIGALFHHHAAAKPDTTKPADAATK